MHREGGPSEEAVSESAEVDITVAGYGRERSEAIRRALRATWENWELRPTVTTRKREADLLRTSQAHPEHPGHLGVRAAVSWPIFREHEWVKTVIAAQARTSFPIYQPGDGYELAKHLTKRVWAANGEPCFVRIRFWNDSEDYRASDANEWANGLGELQQVFDFWESHRALFAAEDRTASGRSDVVGPFAPGSRRSGAWVLRGLVRTD
jgi:hypothetical protein